MGGEGFAAAALSAGIERSHKAVGQGTVEGAVKADHVGDGGMEGELRRFLQPFARRYAPYFDDLIGAC